MELLVEYVLQAVDSTKVEHGRRMVDLCWFHFFVLFGLGGRSCSNFLAPTVNEQISAGTPRIGCLRGRAQAIWESPKMGGPQNGYQYTMILIIGTPKKGPLIVGTPHILTTPPGMLKGASSAKPLD